MSLTVTAEKKKEIFAKFGKSKNDTGSTEGQIALFTARITHLTVFCLRHTNIAFIKKNRPTEY